MRSPSEIRAATADHNVAAFLRLLRMTEGTGQDGRAYRMLFGGELVDSLADHPRRAITKPLGGKPLTSTAAGAYQFLSRTWDECARYLGLQDFGPGSQDAAAVFLIERRRALDDVIAGRIEEAIAKCAREWASLPGSPYGQPTKPLDVCLRAFQEFGGTLNLAAAATLTPPPAAPAPAAPLPTTTEAPTMSPFLLPAISAIVEIVPKLGKIFGSGSEVAQRNVKAAEVVAEIAKEAIGARNEQELVEAIRNDPAAAKAVRDAVEREWYRLDEIGGGIAAARAANERTSTTDPKRNLALWITLALLPLVYITVGSVLWGTGWSQDVKAMVVAAVVSGLLGGITGYWLGTSFSSSKKDDREGKAGA